MGFDGGILISVLASIACVVVITIVFRRYGADKFPWTLLCFIVGFASISLILVLALLPYDISLCLFGATPSQHAGLRLGISFLYWLSFVLAWIIVPVIVSYLNLSHVKRWTYRLYLAIRENVLFYAVCLGILVVGILILAATGNLTLSELPALAQSIGNLYGSLLLCLTLGHGFIALPRLRWIRADLEAQEAYHGNLLGHGSRAHAIAVQTAVEVMRLSQEAKENGKQWLREKIETDDSLGKLNDLIKSLTPWDFDDLKAKPPKLIGKLRKVSFQDWGRGTHEDFLRLVAEATWDLEEALAFIRNEASGVRKAQQRCRSGQLGKAYTVLNRGLAVAMGVINAIFLWGQMTMLGNRRLSLFYVLSHLQIPQAVNILLFSTPILSYFLFVGSWSLRQLNVFNGWYRFVKGATNANTLNYFSMMLCRLAPTIAWQYIQQIEATGSQFESVMGGGMVGLIKGWNTIAEPILIIGTILIFLFRVPDKIAECCGREKFIVDYTVIEYRDQILVEEMLTRIFPATGEPPMLSDAPREEPRAVVSAAEYERDALAMYLI
jgi:hypothetical protein